MDLHYFRFRGASYQYYRSDEAELGLSAEMVGADAVISRYLAVVATLRYLVYVVIPLKCIIPTRPKAL